MAEGMDNVEGRLSCNNSSHDERNLRFPTAAMVLTVEVRARNMAVAEQTRWERSLNQFEPTRTVACLLEPKTTLRLCILLLLVPQDGLEPLQLALMLICMHPHTN